MPKDPEIKAEDLFFEQLEAVQRTVKFLKQTHPHREAGRAFSLVVTKLDEARLWMHEALDMLQDAEIADGDRP